MRKKRQKLYSKFLLDKKLKENNLHHIKKNQIICLGLIFGSFKSNMYKKIIKSTLYKKFEYKGPFYWSTIGRCINLNYKNKRMKLFIKNKKMDIGVHLNINLKVGNVLYLGKKKRIENINEWKY